MADNKRLDKWDNIKFLLILCVVVGHFLKQLNGANIEANRVVLFIYGFHMPAFVFVSGLFSKKTINNRKYDRIISMFNLFLFTKIMRAIGIYIAEKKIKFSISDIGDISWYAFAMAVFMLITILCKQFSPVYMLLISVVISCAAGYAQDIGEIFALGRIIAFYPFFLAGYYLDIEKLESFLKKKYVIISGWLVMLTWAVISYVYNNKLFFLFDLFRAKENYKAMGREFRLYGGAYRIMWYIFATVLVVAIMAIVPSVHTFLSTIGSRTMQIYALHFGMMYIVMDYLPFMNWVNRYIPNHVTMATILLAIATLLILSVKPIKKLVDIIIYPKLIEKK